MNKPSTVVVRQFETLSRTTLDIRMQCMRWIMAAKGLLRNVEAFELDGIPRVNRSDAPMRRLQCREEIA